MGLEVTVPEGEGARISRRCLLYYFRTSADGPAGRARSDRGNLRRIGSSWPCRSCTWSSSWPIGLAAGPVGPLALRSTWGPPLRGAQGPWPLPSSHPS